MLYEGPGTWPVSTLVFDLVLCVVVIGIFLFALHVLQHLKRRYRVTNRKITIEEGLISKRIEVVELFRVQDVSFRSEWGFGQVEVAASDRSTPRLTLAIPQAKQVFESLQSAVASARKEAGVRVQERM